MSRLDYYDEVEIEDFEYDEDEEVYYYPCPCGDQFQISLSDLAAGEEEVTCPSCSLVIKVIYDREVFRIKQEELEKKSDKKESSDENDSNIENKMTGRRGRWNSSRGRSAMPFSIEQFISKGETLPTPVSQPSSSYPPLEHKPPPIQITNEMEYLVGLKRHFTEYMRESPYYVKAPVINEDIERYSDAFKEDFTDNDESKYEKYHDWSLMPEELRAVRKRKLRQHKGNRKKKDMDIMKKLSELEKKENMQEEEDKEEGNEEENGEEKEDGVREEEQDEMDIGTDYTIEHTDNGEIETDDETDDVSFVT